MTTSKPTTARFALASLALTAGILFQGCADRKEAPVMRLIGPDTAYVLHGESYEDRGVIAFDRQDLDISDEVEVIQAIDPEVMGFQIEIYRATDRHGNTSEISRTVEVVESSLDLAGDYRASSNGLTCAGDWMTSHLTPHLGRPGQVHITPIIGGFINSSLVLTFNNDREWSVDSVTNVPCNYITGVNAVMSPSGDTITIRFVEDFTMLRKLLYVRQ